MTDFVFLHGGGQGGWVWDECIGELERRSGGTARCLALDGPGCGTKRGRDTSRMTFEDISRELAADIVASGMRDIVLVGHSQAGMHLPELVELRPDLFRKLVFVTCSAPLPGISTLQQMGESRHGEKHDEVGWPADPAISTMEERFRAMFCNDMDDKSAWTFIGRLGEDMWPMCCYTHSDWRRDHLAAIPVTYVKCLKDKSLPSEWQDRFAERLHADLIVELDAGHQAMNTRPGELADILLAESST